MDFNALNQKIKECAEFAESVQFLVKINKPKNEMGQHFMLALRDLEKILGCEEAGLVKQTKIA
ncbi:MAG: hypothetical protein EBZ49_15595 [Proteobacteria bacterium]|nr:hypothetical protein [Pseudomonadota bacterium]